MRTEIIHLIPRSEVMRAHFFARFSQSMNENRTSSLEVSKCCVFCRPIPYFVFTASARHIQT